MEELEPNIPWSQRLSIFLNRFYWVLVVGAVIIALWINIASSGDFSERISNSIKIIWIIIFGSCTLYTVVNFIFSPLFSKKFNFENIKLIFGLSFISCSVLTVLAVFLYPVSYIYYFYNREDIKQANYKIIEHYYIGDDQSKINSAKWESKWSNAELNRYPINTKEAFERFLEPLCLPDKSYLSYEVSSKTIEPTSSVFSNPQDFNLKPVFSNKLVLASFTTVSDKNLIGIPVLDYLGDNSKKYFDLKGKEIKSKIVDFLEKNNGMKVKVIDIGFESATYLDPEKVDLSLKYYCPNEQFFYSKNWFYKDEFGKYRIPIILKTEVLQDWEKVFELDNDGKILWK